MYTILIQSIKSHVKFSTTGPRFNIKMTSYQYRKSHCGNKTILRASYLNNGICYTGKMTSLYWIGAQFICRISYPWVRCIVCVLSVQTLIFVLPHLLQWCMQYHVILDRVIMVPSFTFFTLYVSLGGIILKCYDLIYEIISGDLVGQFEWCRLVDKSDFWHYSDVMIGVMASQITSLTIVYSTIYSGADQRKHQSSAPLRGIRRWPVNSSHKWPVTPKMFPFDDVIMGIRNSWILSAKNVSFFFKFWSHGPLARYAKLRVRMRRECRERFPRHRK